MLLLLAGEPFHSPEARRLPLLLKSLVILLNSSLVRALDSPETSRRLSVWHRPSSLLTLPCPCVSHCDSSCRRIYSQAVEGCWLDCFVPFTSQGPVRVIWMKVPLTLLSEENVFLWLSTGEAESQCREKDKFGTQMVWGTGTQKIDFWKWLMAQG